MKQLLRDKFIYPLVLVIKNIPGPKVAGKIVIIECDDWGSIRMPSKEVYAKLLRYGIPVDRGWFDRLDTLAGKKDFEELFETLLSVRDKKGNPAVMTPVVSVANPDFKKIKEENFTRYHYESFKDTLERYYPGSNTFKAWQEGMNLGVFVPEYHGREHISVQLWLQKLREGDKNLLYAFDQGYVSVPFPGNLKEIDGYRAEFFFNHPSQIEFFEQSIPDGVKLFKDTFGYTPRAFVPSNGVFHPKLEKIIFREGIKYLYVDHFNLVPDGYGNLKNKYYPIGKTSSSGLTYYRRNCVFEPSATRYRGIDFTMKQINAAFQIGKAAIISTHRVNFVGGISQENRERGLRELKLLLKAILNKWSDIEFLSTGEYIGTRIIHQV